MKKIALPNVNQSAIYDCLEDLIYKKEMSKASKEYLSHLKNVECLYQKEDKKIKCDNIYKNHILDLYKNKFTRQSAKAYEYYKRIRESIKYCPYCNFPRRDASELDHYLPKSKFPILTFTVGNLVPICPYCNKKKLSYFSFKSEEMLVHPYFDEFIAEPLKYIACEILNKLKIDFHFYIKKKEEWNMEEFKKVEFHFQMLKLWDLYHSDFSSEFTSYFEELILIYQDEERVGVEKALERKLKSMNDNYKPWMYAGFSALLNSEWFLGDYLPKKVEEYKK